MDRSSGGSYLRRFLPYALAAFLVGIVGGFTTVLGPAFVRDLGLAENNTTWTALATAISTAAFAPVLGKLADVLGRRTTLLAGVAVFTLGNLLTALAPNLPFMLLARFTVGIGTAAIAPVVMAHILTEFPPNAVARGFSLYMLISSSAVIFGPTLGGLITQRAGWRATMWLCTGICLALLLACWLTHPKTSFRPGSLAGFDGAGAFWILAFFGLLLCVPSFGQNFGWTSGAFLIVLALAAVSLAGLVFTERRAGSPILSGSFLKQRTFLLCIAALFLTQGLMQANMTNLIVFVNNTQPENTAISGYSISIMYLGMSLGAVLLGPLADRFEPKWVLTGSLTLTGIGCAVMLLFGAQTALWTLALSLGVLGFGLGGNGTIFMKVALSGAAGSEAGAGTGTYGLFRDLAAPFGVAVFVPMFTNRIVPGVPASAVAAIHSLARTQLLWVAAGIGAVLLLPKIHQAKGETP